ncbi:MAG: hypothetical protein V4622_10700 [Bacteroidota bacterium]
MKTNSNTLNFGIYSFVGIASFFLIMKLFGLEEYAGLRIFNIFIIVYFTNRLARKNIQDQSDIGYLEALASLFLANFLALVLSIGGFVFYVKIIDPEFLSTFIGGILWLSSKLTLFEIVASLFLEGMAGAIMISFISMQYWQDAKVSAKS